MSVTEQDYKEKTYINLEKSFVQYIDLTKVIELDFTFDSEPFVTLASYGEGLIGKYVKKHDIENLQNQNIIVRESVFKRLQKVDLALKNINKNFQLIVVYGYRSLEIQQQLFNKELEIIKSTFPNLNENEIIENVHRRIAVPDVAGHPTGGAVDVIIHDFEKNVDLDFGTKVRDFSTKDVYYKSEWITNIQKDNRSKLRRVMTAQDFAPYDGEWWHFSYGDKEWAYYKYRDALRKKANTPSLKYYYSQKNPKELVFVDKYRNSAEVIQTGLIRLALQKKGRLTDDTINILIKSGIDVAYDEGKFFGKCNNFPLELLFVRDDDIPSLVDSGAADIGIVGKNIFYESDCKSKILKELGFGRCALAIAVPEGSRIKSIADLSGKKVATSYYRSVNEFFINENIFDVDIVPLSGSVEMAVTIGYADAIVDLVSTGSSLRQNKLEFLHKIFDSESILIANNDSYSNQNQEKLTTIDRLMTRISGYLSAKNYKQIIFSIPTKQLENIDLIQSSTKLLNISNMYNNSENSIVSAIINKNNIWVEIEKLQKIGAIDIAFYDIETIL